MSVSESKIFCGYEVSEQAQVLQRITNIVDAETSSKIKENLDYLEKLSYMATETKMNFFRMIDLKTFAIATKLSTKKFLMHFIKDLSKNMKAEILEFLQNEYKVDEVLSEQEKLIQFIRQKEGSGEYVFTAPEDEVYV